MNFENKKIIFIHTSFVGDIILSIPLLKAINSLFKPKSITVLTTPANKEVFERFPFITDIIIYDKKNLHKNHLAFLKIIMNLRNQKYDLAFLPHRSFRSALISFLARIPMRIGFHDSNNYFIRFLYTHKIGRQLKEHEINKNLRLLTPLLGEKLHFDKELPEDFSYKIPFTEKEAKYISSLVPPLKYIIFAPCSNWDTKAWPAKNYSALANMFADLDYNIVLVASSSKNDLGTCLQIEKDVKKNLVINLAGKTSIAELSALASRANLMITNDSAPMHVGAAHNIPLIAIFGPTTKELGFYPFSTRAVTMEKDLFCRPCGLHGHKKCPNKNFECMTQIRPEEVFKKALELLS